MYFFFIFFVGRVRRRRRLYKEIVRPPHETLVNVKGQMNLNYVILFVKVLKRKDHLFLSNLDSVIYQINHFPADKYKGNQIDYLLVRDLSSRLALCTF